MYLLIYYIKLIKYCYIFMIKYIVNLDKVENVENKLMLNVCFKFYRMRFFKI